MIGLLWPVEYTLSSTSFTCIHFCIIVYFKHIGASYDIQVNCNVRYRRRAEHLPYSDSSAETLAGLEPSSRQTREDNSSRYATSQHL